MFCKNVSFDRESKRIGGRQALAQGQDATGVHGSAAPKEDKMWRMNPSDDDDDGNDWEEGEVDPEKDWEPPDWLR